MRGQVGKLPGEVLGGIPVAARSTHAVRICAIPELRRIPLLGGSLSKDLGSTKIIESTLTVKSLFTLTTSSWYWPPPSSTRKRNGHSDSTRPMEASVNSTLRRCERRSKTEHLGE